MGWGDAMLPFRRPGGKVEVDPEVLAFAQAAYAFVREHTHPVPDGIMREHTRQRLYEARDALSADNRKMLG